MRFFAHAAVIWLALAPGAAQAQVEGRNLNCFAEDGTYVDLQLNQSDVMSVARARLVANEEFYSTMPDEGNWIGVRFAYEDAQIVAVDFSEANTNRVLGRLRLFKPQPPEPSGEGTANSSAATPLPAPDYAAAGIFRLPGIGSWAVTCQEF